MPVEYKYQTSILILRLFIPPSLLAKMHMSMSGPMDKLGYIGLKHSDQLYLKELFFLIDGFFDI